MTKSEGTTTATTSFPGLTLLTITFVVLKALGYIGWSWVWVFAPLWIPPAIILAIGLVILLAVGILKLLYRAADARTRKRKRERGFQR